MIHIREARSRDLPALGRLFDDYRQFYKLPEDVEKATGYITARLARSAAASSSARATPRRREWGGT